MAVAGVLPFLQYAGHMGASSVLVLHSCTCGAQAASIVLGLCLPCLNAAEPCTAFCCVHLQNMRAVPCRSWASMCWS